MRFLSFFLASQDDGAFIHFEPSGSRSSTGLETGMALRRLGSYSYQSDFLSHQFYIVQTSYIKLSNLSTACSSPEPTYQSKQTIADHAANSKTPIHCAHSVKLRLDSLESAISKRLKSSLGQESLPLYHFAPELDQENSLSGPHLALSDSMCRHPCREVCAVTYPFHDSSHKGGAI